MGLCDLYFMVQSVLYFWSFTEFASDSSRFTHR